MAVMQWAETLDAIPKRAYFLCAVFRIEVVLGVGFLSVAF